jgi:site-specific DNA-methyltransferase (adenine-specific)
LADNPHLRSHINGGNGGHIIAHESERRVVTPNADGRWPANIIHDGSEEVLATFPDAPGQSGAVTGDEPSRKTLNCYGEYNGQRNVAIPRADSGSAARFFYCAKASKVDRDEGLDGFPARRMPNDGYGSIQQPKLDRSCPRENWTPHAQRNSHPTVKPTALMRYLCRLVTPPDGLVLDPFMGSGSTGKAAMLEGFRFIGIDSDKVHGYFAIAQARIKAASIPPEPEQRRLFF